MRSKVAITGVGIVSALGDKPAAVHDALCRGESAGASLDIVDGRELAEPGIAAPASHFSAENYLGEKNLRPLDRAGRLSVSAAQLALESGGWTKDLREQNEIDLVVGTTFCSAHTITQFDRNTMVAGPKYAKPLDFANTVINAAAGHTAIWHNLRGANTTVVAGKVSGLRALKHAQIQIADGRSKVALVGGVEEFCFETYCGFKGSGQLHLSNHGTAPVPFHRDREGFMLGEGAAFAVIEEVESARNRGATILGKILGHGSSYDVSRGRDADNATARCARAIQSALDLAGTSLDAVDCIICSANGSRREDRYEALALEKVFGTHVASIPLTTVGGSLGETLGAAGIMQVIAFLEAARDGRLPGVGVDHFDEALPPLAVGDRPTEGTFRTGLVLSLGFDGSSAATIVAAP